MFKSAGRCAAVLTLSGSSDPFRVGVLKDRPGAHPVPLSVPFSVSGDLGTHKRCKYIHIYVRPYTLICCVCMYITSYICNVVCRCVKLCEIILCAMHLI